MSTFTMTVSELMDGDYDADPKRLGLDRYPIYDEGHRPVLNEKIILRYWTREIGFESDSLFRHHMHARMNEIMDYYNELYLTKVHEFDMFETINITNESNNKATAKTESGTTSVATSESTSDGLSRTVNSETPQTRLSPNEDYATAATDAKSESGANSTSETDDKSLTDAEQGSESESVTRGSQGPKALLLMQFREAILNIDTLVLDNLDDLFMNVWSNGDDFTGSRPLYGISPMYPYGFGYFF